MVSAEEKIFPKRSLSIVFLFYCFVLCICLALLSCQSADVKKPRKADQSAVENDESELADAVKSREERPPLNFSPPKENAADVEIEEVRLDVAETKAQQGTTEQVPGSKSPNGNQNNSSTSENLANQLNDVPVALGTRDKNKKSQTQRGISIDLSTNRQEPSSSANWNSDNMNLDRPISSEQESAGEGDAALSKDTGGGAPNDGLGDVLNTIGTTYGKFRKQQSTETIPKIKDEKDEDIVARQIREAAHLETDQILKEKLWLEYERYRSGLKD